MIEFYKYHGAGNDFIMIDNRKDLLIEDKVKFAQQWCSRRFGIGSDGIIFIENSSNPEINYIMDFYNPDGSQSFCGNGSRCAMAFAIKLGIVNTSATFEAIDGVHESKLEDDVYHIHMKDVVEIQHINGDFFIHTGSPHYISYCHENDNRNILDFGKEIRYSEPYKTEGTNVNLLSELGSNHIAIRTYERGVENETLACGTGVTAAALSYAEKHELVDGIVHVDAKGGKLKVKFRRNNKSFNDIWLIGRAEFVYKGTIDV
jgi:diaminopimelate epimerase